MLRPHAVCPSLETVRVAIAYKNFAAHRGVSHIGLGVTALTNVRALQDSGIWAEVWPVTNNIDVVNRIKAAGSPLSHVIISAPWLSTYDLSTMVHAYPRIHFAVVSHSNVGFLQADPSAVRLLRQAANLSLGSTNFSLGGNSKKFVEWWRATYKTPCVYLPNLYPMDDVDRPAKRWKSGAIRIGAFGAIRPLKNLMTSAAAALEIGSRLQADVEFWVSGGRWEGGGEVVYRSIEQMYAGLNHAKLVTAPWSSWPEFRSVIVRSMHLLLQPSYSESFNMVTADGVVEGVPSVVSEAIEWAPRLWKAHHDNASDIASVGIRLLRCPLAVWMGRRALAGHNRLGLRAWREFLLNEKTEVVTA